MNQEILICNILLFLLFLTKTAFCENNVDENFIMRIDLVRQKSPRLKYLEHNELLKKYGYKNMLGPKPPSPPRTNDSIALYRALDNEFYGSIIIGHPAQSFNVAFDTAWTLSWIMSSKCTAKGCAGHYFYDHTKSSQYKKDGRPFNVTSPNLSGFFSYDNITFAHSNVSQSFVEMTYVPDDFVTNKADGIIGLGLKFDSYDPFFYNLLKQKKIKDPIFSIFLNRDSSSPRGGNINLGFIDYKKIHKSVINGKVVMDNITYLPVTSNEYWQFKVDLIVLEPWRGDNRQEHIFCTGGCQAITDTNSNAIFGSQQNIDIIHDAIEAKYDNQTNQFYVNCDTMKTLPHMTFILAGKNFTILPENYILKVTTDKATMCISSFRGSSSSNDWVLGGAFLSQFFSIYNVHENVIGFVRSAAAA